MTLRVLLVWALCSSLSGVVASNVVPRREPHAAPLHDPVSYTRGLITRILGAEYVASFEIATCAPDASSGNDVFVLAAGSAPGTVSLTGSSGVALASGLGWYLKHTCNASWGWGVNNSGHQMSSVPPAGALLTPTTPGRFVSPARYRYAFNTCTFGYSFAWYDTARWQQEIDRSALWGINAPLMPIGLEAAETAVYASMGVTEAELQAWFTGHSHLPWQRMANIKGIAGPLPAASVAQQAVLGAAVSAMMVAAGMTPVLPGFGGHVPDALRRVKPAANITTSSDWGGVGCQFSCDALLQPSDPLFATLGAALNAKVLALFGDGVLEPMFNADTFNEESPESGDEEYLRLWNQEVYGAMTAVVPSAIYVMQAWCFHQSFWTPDRVRAYLAPVPLTRMLILDLNSEDGPVWQNYDSFFGHDWSWSGLIVFGGRRGVYGNLPVLASSVYSARAASPNLVGLGITPEAIDQCGTAFDLVLEAAWRAAPVPDVGAWLQAWAARRYGAPASPSVASAYAILERAVFHASGPDLSVFEKTPQLGAAMSRGTNATGVLAAARLLLAAASSQEVPLGSSTLSYDIVDLVRQTAAGLHADLAALLSERFSVGVCPGAATPSAAADALAAIAAAAAALLADLDAVLAQDVNFLLGAWTEPARAMGVAAGAEAAFMRDAKLLVSLWTPDGTAFGGQIDDYSSRSGWSGLVSSYYAARWGFFGDTLVNATASATRPDWAAWRAALLALEQAWVADTATVFPSTPPPGADAVGAAAAFLEKWTGPAALANFSAHSASKLTPAAPPRPPPPATWTFLGANLAAVGPDCPFLSEPKLTTLAACQAACVQDLRCTFINWDGAAPWCVFRACTDPLHAVLSPAPGYSAYAYNKTGSRGVVVTSVFTDPGALATVCSADPLCVGFDSTGLIVEGEWEVAPAGAGAQAWLRR